MTVIDDYLQKLERPQKLVLEHIRQLIREVVPEAEEVITYGMPGFKYRRKYLVAFAAFKDHLSIFPAAHAIEVLQPELSDYKTSKGTVQFTLEQPLPDALIVKLIKIRRDDIDNSKK